MYTRKGFTLLELIIVIIIIGILATLGTNQYSKIVEKARQSEAKAIIGQMRKSAMAFYLERGTITTIAAPDLNLGAESDMIPQAPNCRGSHWFTYNDLYLGVGEELDLRAYRCGDSRTANYGKPPNVNYNCIIRLKVNFADGTDSGWEKIDSDPQCPSP